MSNKDKNYGRMESVVSRRALLKGIVVTGTAAGAGGLLASCGSDDDAATETAATEAPVVAETSKGTIKIGFVTPQTGPLAPFGEADAFVIGELRNYVASGYEGFTIEILERDSESNSNTAATTVQELIGEGCQLILAEGTPDTTVPVVQQCTNNEIPCITNNAPWQPHYLGIGGQLGPGVTPGVASEYNYHFFWGLEDVVQVFLAMWNDAVPGGKVGALWPDDPDGNAWSDPNVGFPPALAAGGFTLVDPGRFPLGGNDYSAQIAKFKDEGVEIVTGVLPPPDFANFWAQAQQQGFAPKVVTVGKALLFPGAIESYANPAGISTEIWWSDRHPYTSSLTGQTAADLAAAYTASTGRQWTQPVGYVHALFEVALDAIKRAGGADDKQALLDVIGATNMETIAGTVNWGNSVVPHVTKTPLVGGQWVKGSEFPYELKIRTSEQLPSLTVDGPMELIEL
ncbi:MAG: ABC transporter substrate-binding protein [Actinomycetota bacterium]|nr:ABC transporter substrate-binding protein [Actinomycetota bacterium]